MIDGLALLDAVANSNTTYDGESPKALELRFANILVAAALDEMRHIDVVDTCGPTGKWRRLYVRETEKLMRATYENWLAVAQPLLDRARTMSSNGPRVLLLSELETAVLTAQTLLMRTVDQLEAAKEDGRRGNVVSIEEVRRELRARAAS